MVTRAYKTAMLGTTSTVAMETRLKSHPARLVWATNDTIKTAVIMATARDDMNELVYSSELHFKRHLIENNRKLIRKEYKNHG